MRATNKNATVTDTPEMIAARYDEIANMENSRGFDSAMDASVLTFGPLVDGKT